MLTPELITELPVSAASGLVISSGKFFIVSDDDVSLLHGHPATGFQIHKLWDIELPEDPTERKKIKPDLECLYLDGQKLYLLPSFSKKNRAHGAVVHLGQDGDIQGHETSDLSSLRNHLQRRVSDLNIEGAILIQDKLYLFQRGNGKAGSNSIIVCDDLASEKFKLLKLDLPHHKNVPLTVTDATLKDETIYFTAVAEDTDSTYLDGEVVGSFLGTMDSSFRMTSLREIEFSGKPEGLAFDEKGSLYIVTDDDSREKRSRLFVLRD